MADRIADPLLGPPPERVQLNPAPLVRVLGQVQFGKIIKINTEQHIGDFQEAVRSKYPFIEKDTAQAVQLHLDDRGVHTSTSDEVIWRLFDASKDWRVSLNPSALSLETVRYTSRGEFLDRFGFLLDELARTIKPTIATRVGFRYVNRLQRSADLRELDQLVYPELVGVLSAPLREQVEQSISQAVCKTAEGRLLVRWGMLPAGASHDPEMAPPLNSQSWMLDIDSFAMEGLPGDGFAAEILAGLVDTMANRAYAFFRWSVTEKFLERFGARQQ
jgi:uncharacterized protein (TIGR04255 family)